MVIQTSINKHFTHVMLFVPCDFLILASAANQLVGSIPHLVVTASICWISESGTSIAKHPQISSNSNHFSRISYCEQLCFALALQINLSMVSNGFYGFKQVQSAFSKIFITRDNPKLIQNTVHKHSYYIVMTTKHKM